MTAPQPQPQQQQQQPLPQKKRSVFSISSAASVLMTLYIGAAMWNLYKLMYPLATLPWSSSSPTTNDPNQLVRPLWKSGETFHLRVYLSKQPRFNLQFLKAGYEEDESEESENEETKKKTKTSRVIGGAVALLWDETVDSPAFSKSFLLTTNSIDEEDASYKFATAWLDTAERNALERGEGGVLSVVSAAGHGIESTSILLTFYQSMSRNIKSLLTSVSHAIVGSATNTTTTSTTEAEKAAEEARILARETVRLSPTSPLWSAVQSNATLYIHVLVLKKKEASSQQDDDWPPSTAMRLEQAVVAANRDHALLSGSVNLIKYDKPHHIPKPSRILYHDVVYLVNKYILRRSATTDRPPWDMEYAAPEQYSMYQEALQMKKRGAGYPYWKPEVAIKYVSDTVEYPLDYVARSGMPIVRINTKSNSHSHEQQQHPTGYSFTPAIHVDEIGLTSEKYIPVNKTVTSLPLRISFDRSDMEHHHHATTSTAGGISPARWRLLTHLSQALESQKELGFEQSDIDEMRRLIADTNVTLLAITLLASSLHLLFEFLTFKNEVSFWNNNKDLTGLSVRSLFLDMMGQSIILLYLIQQDSSLLITVPSGIGCMIALWKCQRAAGFKFVRIPEKGESKNHSSSRPAWWNWIPRLFGYELRATRLEIRNKRSNSNNKNGSCDDASVSHKDRLHILSLESDRIATRSLGALLLPLVLAYTLYSLAREHHTGWYSWLVTSASSAVYALGFVLMTPQLFLNWKLKSVAHLPWRVLVYKSLNTFIDDLFSFIIRMPTMARISCFRDDVVFFIYLYQRWLYPVDKSRPIEGGGEGAVTEESLDKKEQKKNQ